MKDKKIIELERIKSIQLDILQSVHAFCKNHSIPYSMACGTMLGAVRHHGYIPWDDDIDIYCLRHDYQKLVSLFPSLLDGHYVLVSLETNESWDRPYAKVYDNRTIVIENAECNMRIGISIDVYPIDDVPDNNRTWLFYNHYRRILQKIAIAKGMTFSNRRNLFKNLLVLVIKVIMFPVSRRILSEFLSRVAQMNNNKGYCYVFECVQGMLQKSRFPKHLFNSIELYKFENREFYGFSDFDSYLKNGYGDYMVLPPENKRIIHHDYVAYWK